ncbi:MAG: energy-coupled thiamine transporter ThiT [Clostridia bacterium]|nr:energy-coupled thiamine transporter ThiT [Clostridia bacterium]
MKFKTDVKTLCITGLLIALAVFLGMIKLFSMPQGGSVTAFSMLPLVLIAYYYGPAQGMAAGVCAGLLELILGGFVVHPIQIIMDYPIAYGVLGVGGLLRNQNHGLVKGYILSILCRFFVASLSGYIFFASYAPEGFNALVWSIWYNFTYIAIEGGITIVILSLPKIRNVLENLKNQA